MNQLRVMFQGGGARLVVLLAAAEALQKIEASSAVKIVEVAGVSAGSLAAAALAGHATAQEIRTRFTDASQHFIVRQRKNLAKLRRRPSLTSGTTLLMLRDILAGHSILSRGALKRVLHQTFSGASDGRPLTMGETRIPLSVFVSNLKQGQSIALSTKNNHSLTVAEAVERSVSLPFVFSTFETGDETDGGICGNLPVGYFGQDPDHDGRILAIHFPPDQIEYDDAIGYARALLTSSMNASVREAIDQTKRYGGVACEIPTWGIDTFDFDSALSFAKDKEKFDLLVESLKPILNAKLGALFDGPRVTGLSAKRYQTLPSVRIHEGLRRDFPYEKILSAQAQIHQRARQLEIADFATKNDRLLMTCHFKPSSNNTLGGLKAIRQGLPFGYMTAALLNVRLRDKFGRDVPHIAELLSTNTENGLIQNEMMIFFESVLSAEDCPAELRISFEYPALKLLREKGADWSRSFSLVDERGTGTMTERLWIIVTPVDLPLSIRDLTELLPDELPDEFARDLDKMKAAWSPGQRLNASESRGHFAALFDDLTVANAQMVGWKVNPFRRETYCGFAISDKSPS